MAKIQCPNCFEQIDMSVEARRNYQSRRCPKGMSSRVKVGAGLQHCYCRVIHFDDMSDQPYSERRCCRCGDLLKAKAPPA